MGGSFVADQDLTRWALRVPLPRSPHIGTDRVGRVLVALVQYADSDGIAWPSAERLADDVSGISRRDARSALDLLAGAGLIAPAEAPSRGRARRWQVGPREVAGIPANPLAEDLAGIPATSGSVNVAGDMAGNLAGNMAGIPAPNRTEEKKTPAPTSQVAVVPRPETEQADESAVHEYEATARRNLAALHLPLDLEELVAAARRLGHGDLWAGYRVVKHRAEGADLAGAKSAAGLLRYLLKADAPKPRDARAPSGPPECETHPGWPLPCIKCADIAKEQQQTEDAA